MYQFVARFRLQSHWLALLPAYNAFLFNQCRVVEGLDSRVLGLLAHPQDGCGRVHIEVLGDMNYWYNMQPYYDIENINTYPSASPSDRQRTED